MSLATIAAMAKDMDLLERVAACVATQELEHPGTAPYPWAWTLERAWLVAALPGWAEKYAYALAGGKDRPGLDGAVITDGDILAGVQRLTARPTVVVNE